MKSIIVKTDVRHGIGVRVCVHMQDALSADEMDEILKDMEVSYIHGLTLCIETEMTTRCVDNIKQLISAVHQKFEDTKTIWVYVGAYFEDLDPMLRGVVAAVDVLVDGPSNVKTEQDSKSFPRFRTSHAQRVLDMPRTLAEKKAVTWYDSYYANRMLDPNTHE